MSDMTPDRIRPYFSFLDAKSVVLSILKRFLHLGIPVLCLLFQQRIPLHLSHLLELEFGFAFDFAPESGILWFTERIYTERRISFGSLGEFIILFINQQFRSSQPLSLLQRTFCIQHHHSDPQRYLQ